MENSQISFISQDGCDDCRVPLLNGLQGLPGKKWGTAVRLFSGLEFVCVKLDSHNDIAMRFQRDHAFLEFGCLLSGHVRGCSHLCNGEKQHFGGEAGQTWFSHCPKAHGTIEYLSGQPIWVIIFLVSAPLLDTFIPSNQPDIMSCRNRNESLISFNGTGSVTPEVSQIVRQIMQKNNLSNELNRLYLISKSYELLFHLMADKHKNDSNALSSVKPECVYRASRIILENLESPPALADLAKQSGLCTTSLNAGFRKVFGTTVFGYLRQERLSKAKHLMEHENKFASEAAWEVGYSSLSSFHRAFYTQYGVTPGHYSKNN